MSVRAKFRVLNLTEKADGGFVVQLSPVIADNAENKEFYKLTPGGNIHLETISESAASQFEVNKDYYVDFTPAPMPEPVIGNEDTEAEAHAEQEAEPEQESTNTEEDTQNV